MNLKAHTDKQTDGHGDSMTNSAQWGRVGKNKESRLSNLPKLQTNVISGDVVCHAKKTFVSDVWQFWLRNCLISPAEKNRFGGLQEPS